jgi:hypothetical protein
LYSFHCLDRLVSFTSQVASALAFIFQIGFSVDVGGINRDVAQPSADGVDIYSGSQKMCGGRVAPVPHAG